MSGLTLLFVLIGLAMTAALFGVIAAIRRSRDHEAAAGISIVLGGVLLLTPVRGTVISTFGDAAAAAATFLWGVIFLGAWIVGSVLGYMLLKKAAP